jgi:hypothetical protein
MKFLQDAVTKSAGIDDDSCVFEVHMRKREGKVPQAVVRLSGLREEGYLLGEGTKDETSKDAQDPKRTDKSGRAEPDRAGEPGAVQRVVRVSSNATRAIGRRFAVNASAKR